MATLAETKPRKSSRKSASEGTPSGGAIRVWEDDPSSGVAVTLDARPDPDAAPLAYDFRDAAPDPSDDTETFAFRYWTAVAALRRGAEFWAPRVPGARWQRGQVLPVFMDEGEDLNAFYDRRALHFFHGQGPDGPVFSGASPDILLHEMGHAILDSLKPQLFDVASQEAAAFHESFGDICAILGALQLPSLRTAILDDTGGRLGRNSRLSRIAEQLGAAIRAQSPGAVDPDCLRNAANSFGYADPSTLPPRAPAAQLSSEAHSFSRVFTGAFLDALAGVLRAHAGDPDAPTADELAEVSVEMRDILAEGVANAPVVSNFMAQVAAGMVVASGSVDRDYPAILREAFTRRSILSLQTGLLAMTMPAARFAMSAAEAEAPGTLALAMVALPATHYGLDEPLSVAAPSQPRRMVSMAARADLTPAEPMSAVGAATQFVDDLFAQGRVEAPEAAARGMTAARSARLKTHKVVREDGTLALKRILFDCGCGCHGGG